MFVTSKYVLHITSQHLFFFTINSLFKRSTQQGQGPFSSRSSQTFRAFPGVTHFSLYGEKFYVVKLHNNFAFCHLDMFKNQHVGWQFRSGTKGFREFRETGPMQERDNF